MNKRSIVKTVKKVVSFFIAVILVMSVGTEWTSVRSEAATIHTQSEAVSWAYSLQNPIDYDGEWGCQCVDLIAAYYQYLGTRTPGGNAIAYKDNTLPSGWKRVYDDYQPGDIAVYKTGRTYYKNSRNENTYIEPRSTYGHVSIIGRVQGGYLYVIEQADGHLNKDSEHPKEALICAIRPDFINSGETPQIFTNIRASDIQTDDATIYVDTPSKPYCTEVGFYISTDSSMANASRISEAANCQVPGMFYNMKKWYGALSESTTYYYKFYAISGGTEYTTDVHSFTTLSNSLGDNLFTSVYEENITENNARISGVLSSYQTIQDCGFQISTNPDMSGCSTHYESDKNAGANGAYISAIGYTMSDWHGTLQKGTVYYYRLFMKINGTTYMTSVRSFKTLGDITPPVIQGVNVVSIDGNGYTISAKATDETGMLKMSFPTWTEYNGQDDIKAEWWDTTAVTSPDANGNYTYRVNISDHNYESGKYITHIYAYDSSWNNINTQIEVYVYPLVSISFSESNVVLNKGDTKYLSVGFNPEYTTDNGSINFTSSNVNVATVDDTGRVTAKSAGDTTITATVSGKTATCKVTVANPLKSISLSKTSLDLIEGGSSTLSVSYNPSDTTDSKAITWSSSNTKVATVDKNGKVTAVGEGSAKITATSAVKGIAQKECSVNVSAKKDENNSGNNGNGGSSGSGNGGESGNGGDTVVDNTPVLGWYTKSGKSYWYENGIRQGTATDSKGVWGDGTNRGREIYDSESDGWYWLDSIYDGAKATGKEVWMPYIYQNEDEWNDESKRNIAYESDEGMGECVYNAIKNKSGKWVRYDENGKMLKGWVKIEGALATLYPNQAGNTYYYDTRTGLMAKGWVTIGGVSYYFDETTGVLQ